MIIAREKVYRSTRYLLSKDFKYLNSKEDSEVLSCKVLFNCVELQHAIKHSKFWGVGDSRLFVMQMSIV